MQRIQVDSGSTFGRLTVEHEAEPAVYPSRTDRRFTCRCTCGQQVTTSLKRLRSGETQSCGCLQRERAAQASSEQKRKHGLSSHYLYKVWMAARSRCENHNDQAYRYYGGRGIRMHPAWRDSPEGFLNYIDRELGPRPEGHSLDRVNNNKGYEPNNLRWATAQEQADNSRRKRNPT